MRRTLLKSKLHRATVTETCLHYSGSLTLDRNLMEQADLLPHERIEIYDLTNGSRLATYVIPGQRGSGEVVVNGAAALLVNTGDLVIICSYAEYEEEEALRHEPRVLILNEVNQVVPEIPVAKALTKSLSDSAM
ncbi:MAG TPA: aspartate 1-decarboxylase [Thermoanaerobaculia bacterium]|nr:aspartate 1-decarboxylase [Thermoanaerobaculia bacterium]